MNSITKLAAGLVMCLAAGPAAQATTLLNVTTALTASDPTQLGRTSRQTVQQDWINSEQPYPGPATGTGSATFNYRTFTLTPANLENGAYVQIEVDEPSAAGIFASAYLNSYDPANQGTNWLGDAGSSENYGVSPFLPESDPRFFNVIVPVGNSLVVVINTTGAVGLGENFGLVVEGFSDVSYTDIAPVPEPSSIFLLGGGALLGFGTCLVHRRRA